MRVCLYGGPEHGKVIDWYGGPCIDFVESPPREWLKVPKPQKLTWLQQKAVEWLKIHVEAPVQFVGSIRRTYYIHEFRMMGCRVYIATYETRETPSEEEAFDFVMWIRRREAREKRKEEDVRDSSSRPSPG